MQGYLFNMETPESPIKASFKEWQLREGMRLYQYGRQLLSDTELLAHLIRDRDLATIILDYYGSLAAVADASIEELKLIYGVGDVMAERISVAFELGRRCRPKECTTDVQSPSAVFHLLRDEMEELKQEHLKVILLTTRSTLIRMETVFIGTLDSSVIHPRSIFRAAIRGSAASIILAHNHPAGDPTPSTDDIEVTKALHQAARLVQISMLDHVIVGRDSYVSLKEQGVI